MQIIVSPFTSPVHNCALEELLLAERQDDLLLLYVNTPSVIVGKYQTVEAEADVDFCRASGIEIVRRISGGGAVYHDEGNVNFSFIVAKDDGLALDRDFTAPIVAALQHAGVNASVGRRREIRCGAYKISGTAAHVSRGRQLFHGTLLYSTDLQQLQKALQGNASLRGRGIASVPDRVKNIADILQSSEPTEMFLQKLKDFFRQYYQLSECSFLSEKEIKKVEMSA
jgi:lipoate-protein ligase A